MAPGGPLPLAPLGHPAGLPLRRCACSGQKRYARHIPAPPLALPPSGPGSAVRSAAALGPGSLRAPPGVRRRVPLRLSGSAYRAGPRPPSGGSPAPRRPRCGPSCGPSRLGPARLGPGFAWSPCGALRAPWWSPWALSGLPGSPGAARCAGAPRLPRASPGCASLALPAPAGGLGGPSGRFFRPPGPRRFWGLGCSAAAAAGAGAIGPRSRLFLRVFVHQKGCFDGSRPLSRIVDKGILLVPGG